jgi:hypothetical protein
MFGSNRRAAEKAAREAAASAARVALLQDLLDQARTFQGVTGDEAAEASPVPLKRDERLLLCVQGAALIEPRKRAGHWEGRSQGVSVPVPGLRGVRYRVGASRGTYVQGEEVPTPVDIGSFTVTTARAVFVGPKQTREWAWTKLLGITHAVDSPWTAISVSNRQKTSGVLYDNEHEDVVRFNIDLAVAIATGERDGLVKELEEDLAHARAELSPHGPAITPG